MRGASPDRRAARCAGVPEDADVAAVFGQLLQTNDGSTASEVAALRERLASEGCAEALQCRYWGEAEDAWLAGNCSTVSLDESGVGCSCDHLTTFMTVQAPAS